MSLLIAFECAFPCHSQGGAVRYFMEGVLNVENSSHGKHCVCGAIQHKFRGATKFKAFALTLD